jgi:hypothetical protein
MKRTALVATLVCVAALVAAGVGSAARTTQSLTCGGFGSITVSVTTTTAENSVAWGTASISGGTHLIPTSFTFTVTDLTANAVVFSDVEVKGNGNGQHNQAQINCSIPSETGTAGDLGIPGVDPSHIVEIDSSATAVVKP